VAYFYFDNGINPTPYQALGSIICQLCLRHDLAIPTIVQRWVKGDGKETGNLDPADQDGLWVAFSRLMPEFGTVTICIDALDECSDRKTLVQLLDKLKRLSCRIAVASRLQNWLEPVAKDAYKVSMDRENQEDIRQYVRTFLGGKPKLADIMDESLKRNIENAVTEKAAGMFLWAKLALDGILQQTTTSELKQYIQDLPDGLSSTTNLILNKIAAQPPNRAELARRVLTWLSYAKRPLTLSEIQEAAGITPDSAIIDIEKMAPAWAIEETCMGLVVVDPDTDRVQLVHNTIAEYLCDSKEKLFPRGNETVANCCLSYLQSENLSLDPQKDRTGIRDQPFAIYASGYWGFHVREYWKDTGAPPKALELMNQPQLLKALGELARYSRPAHDGTYRQLQSESFGMLHIAAYFDLVELIMPYMESIPTDITATDFEGRTPLHIASERGHLDSCNALLQKGADVNHKDTGGQTPLSYAVAGNHPEVVHTLCEAGAESNGRIRAGFNWTFMEHAAANGFTKVVEVLLSVTTPKLRQYIGGDSLCLAAGVGNIDIVKLLLEHSIDYNEDQALLRAAENGSKDIVLLLYEYGANMRATDAEGMTPLHLAAAHNHVDLMKVIISEGSSLDQTDRRGRTPLFLASENGCEKAIRLLVERGAKIESLDELGCTPLTLSAENGHSEIVRFLLDHSARSNSSASNLSKTSDTNQHPHLSPLQIACQRGHISVVRTLLEKQWDPEDQGQVIRTPLSYASEGGHSAIVDLLLKNPIVDVNATDGEKRTPLSYAAALGHSDVVLKLLEQPQIKADIPDHHKRTPLSYAAGNGHTDTVKLLLRSSPAISFGSDDSGLSPRDYAAKFNHMEIEKMLQNHGFMLSPV
jgi:ankyrin repeat protein